MDILQLIALGLGFIGSVLLSTGLLKTRQQLDDETASYWGHNPFLKDNIAGEQRLVFLGFVALVAGFSFQFATAVSFYPKGGELFGAILLGVTLTTLGVLALTTFMRSREDHHRRRHEAHYRAMLARRIRSMRDALHDAMYAAHPEELPKLVTMQASSLRDFKGDVEAELWTHLDEELISKLEQEQDKTVERLERHMIEFEDRYLGKQ